MFFFSDIEIDLGSFESGKYIKLKKYIRMKKPQLLMWVPFSLNKDSMKIF